MIWFSEGELFSEICRCYRRETTWFWYRDVLRQAEQRGFLKIVGHSDKNPFWWRTFEDSVEVTSAKLAELMRQETDRKVA